MTGSLRESEDNLCCFRRLSDGSYRLIYEITKNCNLRCAHCMVDPDRYVLPKDRIISLMHELPKSQIAKIMITGGEPLTLKFICEIIGIASSYNILTDINSNLTLLTKQIARSLRRAGLSEATTSIDGNEKSHNLIRRDSQAFVRAARGIEYLVNEGIKVDVVCVVCKDTLPYLQDALEAAMKTGASSITYSGLILEGNAKAHMLPFEKDVNDTLKNLRKASSSSNKDFPIRTVRLLNLDNVECHKGEDIIGIDHKGYVHPCLLSKAERVINILDNTLDSAISEIKRNINYAGGCW